MKYTPLYFSLANPLQQQQRSPSTLSNNGIRRNSTISANNYAIVHSIATIVTIVGCTARLDVQGVGCNNPQVGKVVGLELDPLLLLNAAVVMQESDLVLAT